MECESKGKVPSGIQQNLNIFDLIIAKRESWTECLFSLSLKSENYMTGRMADYVKDCVPT